MTGKTDKNMKIVCITVVFMMFILMLFPVFWIASSSFKGTSELFSYPPTMLPKNFTVENYTKAFKAGNFGVYFMNTVFVTVTSTIITVIINTMAGYSFAKYKFKGRDIIFVAFLCTTMIPTTLIMNPTFTVINKMGLYDSLWGIIIPPAATPTGIFLMRQYFLSMPDSLIESARIDGASEWAIFFRIILPLAKPVIAILTIFSFMWRWNDFIWPLLVISTPKKYTLQLAISNFAGENNVDWSSLLAISVVSMIPVLIIFLIFQKHIINGMMTSGMKE